jgi:peptide/nickel transport system ATP-binding protein
MKPMSHMSHVALAPGEPLLEVDNLRTHFHTLNGVVRSVDGVSYTVRAGRTLGVVGESGCGKSVTALSILRLVPTPPGRHMGSVRLRGTDLTQLSEREMRQIRGNRISMIFQEPMTSLNPVLTVGRQIAETVQLHQKASRAEALQRAVEMLRVVQIPEPERRVNEYPHQLSGGMRQRVMIALALACNPKLLIADEPTTGLDVTTQAAIMALVAEKARARGMATLLITHDLGLARERCDRIVVMHAGHVVEAAPTEALFREPRHPYTRLLIGATPVGRASLAELSSIGGNLPDLRRTELPACRFSERCAYRSSACAAPLPTVQDGLHMVRCHRPDPAAAPMERVAA